MQFKIQKPSIKCDRANLFYGYHNIVRLTTKTGDSHEKKMDSICSSNYRNPKWKVCEKKPS